MRKRAFLEKTRFFESGFPERISGASDDQRMVQLRFATERTVDLIVREYERRTGKICWSSTAMFRHRKYSKHWRRPCGRSIALHRFAG